MPLKLLVIRSLIVPGERNDRYLPAAKTRSSGSDEEGKSPGEITSQETSKCLRAAIILANATCNDQLTSSVEIIHKSVSTVSSVPVNLFPSPLRIAKIYFQRIHTITLIFHLLKDAVCGIKLALSQVWTDFIEAAVRISETSYRDTNLRRGMITR